MKFSTSSGLSKKYQPFKFKQFDVAQDKCAMKIGTDGVLLGAWAPVEGEDILDIGTGTGVIALMLAQRNPTAQIDAIDIDAEAVKQAEENFKASPWSGNLTVLHTDLNRYKSKKKYDNIVSNPPYFSNSTPAPKADRQKVRHTVQLNFEGLLKAAAELLKDSGKLSVILPYTEGLNFIDLARVTGLYAEHITEFHSRPNKPVERLLITLSKKNLPVKTDLLIHYNINNEWAEPYKELTKDYYIVL